MSSPIDSSYGNLLGNGPLSKASKQSKAAALVHFEDFLHTRFPGNCVYFI